MKTHIFWSLLVLLLVNSHNQFAQDHFQLPDSYPDFNLRYADQPGDGYYFLSGTYLAEQPVSYAFVLDTAGYAVFFQKQPRPNRAIGFRLQQNGLLSYYNGFINTSDSKFTVLDSAYSFVDEMGPSNGYVLDTHEFIILDDNSYLVLAQDTRTVDMSEIVDGGQPDATVIGAVIQHISMSGDVIFEWNSFDHFEITDCDTRFVDLTGYVVDYVHANALSVDYDGNILLSSRHLNEITKINTSTGKIMWRWGGKMNEFDFQPSEAMFSGQHSIGYNASDDTYTLFDNGNWREPQYSRGLEFELDQQHKIAKLKKVYDHQQELYCGSRGGIQRLDNGTTILNWSNNEEKIVFTEYDQYDQKQLEINCPDTAFVCYRVFKHPWHTNLFEFEEDSLDFVSTEIGTPVYMNLNIRNLQDQTLIINGSHCSQSAFSISSELPVVVAPHSSQSLLVEFKPQEPRYYEGVLSVLHQTDTSRVARQIRLSGNTVVNTPETSGSVSRLPILYPNPCRISSGSLCVNGRAINQLKIFNAVGDLLFKRDYPNANEIIIPTDMLTHTGIYFVSVRTESKAILRKLLVIK